MLTESLLWGLWACAVVVGVHLNQGPLYRIALPRGYRLQAPHEEQPSSPGCWLLRTVDLGLSTEFHFGLCLPTPRSTPRNTYQIQALLSNEMSSAQT